MGFLSEAVVFLAAAIICVPLFRRLGFGSVLGYLAAGVLIGPWGFRLINDPDNIFRFAELGVVFLLFVIGLELQPSRLWVLRKQVFGLGFAQVAVTGSALAGLGLVIGLAPAAAWLAGFALALSSTAFVLQMLAEKKQLTTVHGRWGFAVLLFQDLAVIPLLALVPLLGAGTADMDVSITRQITINVVAIIVIFVGGRYILRHVFRAIARWGTEESFTAAGLLVVIGAALLVETIHLSMGLGAFLAGMLLADSEYRHQLDADIATFKGLLLGLFFIAVGMQANITLFGEQWLQVLALTAGLLAVKFVVLLLLGRLFGLSWEPARDLGLTLPQGGEFAFVILTVAIANQVIPASLAELLIVVVTVSMAATPLLFILNERLIKPRLGAGPRPFDTIPDDHNAVVIAGFGRVGQIVGRILAMRGIPFTAIDSNVQQVDIVRRYGNKVYYGEAHRLEILRAAGVPHAKVLLLAMDDTEESLKTAQAVKTHCPDVQVYARARNRYHALRLMDLGISCQIRETLLSSLALARGVLRELGDSEAQAAEATRTFEEFDQQLLNR